MTNDSITAVSGIRVGHWSDSEAMTGCTVVVLPEPNTITGEVRGAAPGSRELALLEPGMSVTQAQAVLLTGGSAFGLAAADGVMRGLESDGRGHDTGVARVPIVPSAVIFDLVPGDPAVRPGPDEGEEAYLGAVDDAVGSGRVGVGTGATVAKWRGFEHLMPGGLGSSAERVEDVTVGALAVVNAVGDVFTAEGEALTGGDHLPGPPAMVPDEVANTTLVVLATDAGLTRLDLSRLVVRAHDALAVCLRPAHTRYDGDVVFAVSAGDREADVDALGEAGFKAVARAIEKAVRASNEWG